jgi:hypothetical protein
VSEGSFTVKTTGARDIITSEQTLRDADKGAGGIVLMPHNSTNQVLGIHNESDKPQTGIHTYTWELLTAVVGLYLVRFMPSSVKEHSACMSAIIHLNNAMLAFQDTKSSVTAGVLISGGYSFWVVEEDTRDKTMKRLYNIGDPRLISWMRSHPKKDNCAKNPDEMATMKILYNIGHPRLIS